MNPERTTGLRAYGVSLSVHGGDVRLRDALQTRASALGWIEAERATIDLDYAVVVHDRSLVLRCNGEDVGSAHDIDALADTFENHAKIEMALRARDHVFVHAGVVGCRGGAIVIPGRSRSGKTTLVEALVRAGAEYYSDEFAVLDAQGRVHPYAIPLGIREAAGRRAVPVDAIGGHAGTIPLPVRRIVLTEYHANARWRPRSVSPALGMLALMDNTVAARTAPDRTMPVLRQAAEGATIVRSRRGDANAVAHALLAETA